MKKELYKFKLFEDTEWGGKKDDIITIDGVYKNKKGYEYKSVGGTLVKVNTSWPVTSSIVSDDGKRIMLIPVG